MLNGTDGWIPESIFLIGDTDTVNPACLEAIRIGQAISGLMLEIRPIVQDM